MALRLGLLLAVLAAARPGSSAELLGGRAELHGYGELQLRGIVRDFDFSDGFDLSQWANVLRERDELFLRLRYAF